MNLYRRRIRLSAEKQAILRILAGSHDAPAIIGFVASAVGLATALLLLALMLAAVGLGSVFLKP